MIGHPKVVIGCITLSANLGAAQHGRHFVNQTLALCKYPAIVMIMSDSNELAETRTDWAEDRTILANERTFAGWMRTGMACLGVALGLKAVFSGFSPTWVPKLVANVFVIVAIFIFWSARNKSCQTLRRMQDHATTPQPTTNMTLIAVVMTVGAVATGAILWWL